LVFIRLTIASTFSKCVKLVAVAVAVSFGNVRASALVDFTRTVAHATRVQCTHAVVHVVADAVRIGIRCAIATAHAKRIKLVAVAVAVAGRDVRTSALVDGSWAVANPACIKRANAVVHVVTDAVVVRVSSAVTPTHACRIKLVAVAIAVAGRDVRTSAFIDLAWTVAHAARVKHADTVVHVVADAVRIGVCRAVTSAYAKGVEFRAGTVVICCRWVVVARGCIRAPKCFGIANAIPVCVGWASSTANSKRVKLVAVAVAVAFGDSRTTALVNLAWAVAHAACVKRANAIVHVVADAVRIRVRCAVAATHA
jgi:hypothetical protein